VDVNLLLHAVFNPEISNYIENIENIETNAGNDH
jgi:hypothetical protein